ncbi:VOC family protein [Actinomadura parmotrematis]|uniref:VOC family protein n=1 Tax=Actinomadura parmotrematis TaxID=2864039 RepID=A0ABS7FYF8_9ACTN|nr:VOC family protein [Actinomadura parmotrematis]MBW8485467.1 VOC family protein [Actinomadura parmotrematis]
MLTIGTIVLAAEDMQRAADFWCAALDYRRRDGEQRGDWTVLVPAAGGGPQIGLQPAGGPAEKRPRVHLDLYSEQQAAEVERLVGLGARLVDWDLYPEDPDFVVLADPEDNIFCVIDAAE